MIYFNLLKPNPNQSYVFHKRFVKDVPTGFRPLAPDNEILSSDFGIVLSLQTKSTSMGENYSIVVTWFRIKSVSSIRSVGGCYLL